MIMSKVPMTRECLVFFLLRCKDRLESKYNFIGRTLFAVETVNFVGNVNNTTCDIILRNDF